MFEFRIGGLDEAHSQFMAAWPTRIVSLVSPNVAMTLPRHGNHHLIVAVEDFATPGLMAPQLRDINDILAFTADLTDADRLFVHCHLGQSRSTAAMIGILMQHGLSDEAAFDSVLAARPIAHPNMLICQHLDSIFLSDLQKINSQHLLRSLARTSNVAKPSTEDVDAMQNIINLFSDVI
jgi:predicted protein tyrosine phosphatase